MGLGKRVLELVGFAASDEGVDRVVGCCKMSGS